MNNGNNNLPNVMFKNVSNGGQMLLFMFWFQTSVKLYHWYTDSYANHKATNKLTKNLLELIDSFVEKYIGAFGRPTMRSSSIPVTNMTKAKYIKTLKTAQEYFRGPLDKLVSKNTELLNIRDELLGEIDQALYFATLK
jgi:DNA-binding ferritin-like protein